MTNNLSDSEKVNLIEKSLAENTRRRGGMKARAISEFGYFVREMRSYLTFGDVSQEYEDFQEEYVDRDKFSSQNIYDYFLLYLMYDNQWYLSDEIQENLEEKLENFLDEE